MTLEPFNFQYLFSEILTGTAKGRNSCKEQPKRSTSKPATSYGNGNEMIISYQVFHNIDRLNDEYLLIPENFIKVIY